MSIETHLSSSFSFSFSFCYYFDLLNHIAYTINIRKSDIRNLAKNLLIALTISLVFSLLPLMQIHLNWMV